MTRRPVTAVGLGGEHRVRLVTERSIPLHCAFGLGARVGPDRPEGRPGGRRIRAGSRGSAGREPARAAAPLVLTSRPGPSRRGARAAESIPDTRAPRSEWPPRPGAPSLEAEGGKTKGNCVRTMGEERDRARKGGPWERKQLALAPWDEKKEGESRAARAWRLTGSRCSVPVPDERTGRSRFAR